MFNAQRRAFVADRRRENRGHDADAINPDARATGPLASGLEQEAGDSVVIAGDIEIVLLWVKGDRAHIGIIAPEGVTIAPA